MYIVAPHIGHLYTAVIADTFTRYNNTLLNKPTYFLTGTDEHGSKVYQKAIELGYNQNDIIKYCDNISNQFKQLFDQCHIKYNRYIRTTEQQHKQVVHAIWNILYNKGLIYKGEHTGYYSQIDECFVTEKQIIKNETTNQYVTIEGNNNVEYVSETNYKFKLSQYQDIILNYLKSICTDDNQSTIIPSYRAQEMINWIESNNLHDLSVSRPSERVQWGIDVPNDNTHNIYVWLDALVNYLTAACSIDTDNNNITTSDIWPIDYHIIGKDILRFHSVYWPAFLSAANLSLPKHITVHGHWTVDNRKMSKSYGNVIDPYMLINTYGIDCTRLYLLSCGSIYDDCNYTQSDIIKQSNLIADQFGNLLLRVTSKSILQDMNMPTIDNIDNIDESSKQLIQHMNSIADSVSTSYSTFQFYQVINTVMSLLRQCNVYIEEQQPWKLCKHNRQQCNIVVNITLQCIRICSILLQPIMPVSTDNILNQLSISQQQRTLQYAKFDYNAQSYKLQLDRKPLFMKHTL